MHRIFLASVLVAGITLPASASTIYKCTDDHGGTLISNTRIDKSCKPVGPVTDAGVPMTPGAKPRPPGAASNPTPAGFPKVSEDAQKARDTDRRRILEQEMAAEQKGLANARKDLADQEAVRGDERNPQRQQERLLPYKERVAQHERNIEAISKELANLK